LGSVSYWNSYRSDHSTVNAIRRELNLSWELWGKYKRNWLA
jgi:hypothetical protein